MTVQITANGLDQWGALQNALNGDTHVVLSGQVLVSRTVSISKPGATLTSLNGPLVDGIQSINDGGPCFITKVFRPDDLLDGGDWYWPRSYRMERVGGVGTTPMLPYVIAVQANHQREHIDITGDNTAVSNIFVRGTKRVAGRSMTWRYDPATGIVGSERNHLEAQTGVDVHGAQTCNVTNVNIFGVWGDFFGANPSGAGASNKNSQHVTVDGGTFDLAGRHAFGANGTNHMVWKNTVCSRHVSDWFHIEATTGNSLIYQNDFLLQDLDDDEALEAVHVRTGNGVDDLIARRMNVTAGEFRMSSANSQTGVRTNRFTIDACTWTVRIDNTGELCQVTNMDTMSVVNCAGPMQAPATLVSQTTSNGITATFAGNPGITIV